MLSAVGDNLRGAIFPVAGDGGVEAEGEEVSGFESDRLIAEVVERADEEARAAEEQDAKRDLSADGEFTEALRAFGCGAGVLAQGIGQIRTQEMEHRSARKTEA